MPDAEFAEFTPAEISSLILKAFGPWIGVAWKARGTGNHVTRAAEASVQTSTGSMTLRLFEKDGRVSDERSGRLIGSHPGAPEHPKNTRYEKAARQARAGNRTGLGW